MKPHFTQPNHSLRAACLFALLIAALWPVAARAQSCYLQYEMTIGNVQDGTQNKSYNSGAIQSTNKLTANLGTTDSICASTATPVATYGGLQLTANCSMNYPTSNGNGYIARF